MSYHVGRPSIFEGKTFFGATGMPMRKIALVSTRLADWLPDPLTVAARMVRSLAVFTLRYSGTDALFHVRTRERNVLCGAAVDPSRRLAVERFFHFCRSAGREHSGRYRDAFADDAPRRDERALTDHCAAQYHGVAADQGKLLDAAIFHYRAVPHGDVVGDDRLPVFADVQHAVVLDRRARADANRPVVAAKHCAEPDARFLADFDVADEDRGR